MISETTLLAAHSAATLFMTGVIWVIQLVHYPLFSSYDIAGFDRAHRLHSQRITIIVGPAMFAELVLAAAVLLRWGVSHAPGALGLALLLVIWTVTAVRMIPLHNRLAREGCRPALLTSLLRWNWARTAAWSLRAAICLLWLEAP